MYTVALFDCCNIAFEHNMIILHIKNKNYKLKDDIFNCLFLKHIVVKRNRVDMLILFIKECLQDSKLETNYNLDDIYSLILQFYYVVENKIKLES